MAVLLSGRRAISLDKECILDKEDEIESKAQTAQRGKITYTSPRLIKYGQVRSLTQSGSRPGNEDTSSTSGDMDKIMVGSDRAMKTDIRKVGSHPSGFGIYLFKYKTELREEFGHESQFGVMADEVEAVMPEAVVLYPDGFKRVNYAMLGITRSGNRLH